MLVSNGTVIIDLRKATLRDMFRRETMVTRLMILCGPEREVNYRILARVVTQAVKIEGLTLALPTEDDADQALVEKWNAWIDTVTEDIEDKLYSVFGDMLAGIDPATGPLPLPGDTSKNS